MKQDTISQFHHFWDVYSRVVTGFDGDEWRRSGEGLTRPDRLAFHIFQSTRFYAKDTDSLFLASGPSFERDQDDVRPGREDILALVDYFTDLCDRWIGEMDFSSENRDFPWTGRTRFSIVLFLIRHNTYHLGELEGLLNRCRNGRAPDFWVDSLKGIES
jgi:hypothetical protein